MTVSISKRNFLKSLATTAAAAAGTTALPAFAATSAPKKWDAEFDVVVIGYGGAGANSAICAHDAGAKVLIVEKMPTPGGNTSVSSGNILFSKDKEKTRRYISKLFSYSRCELDQDLFEVYLEGLTDTMNWIRKLNPDVNLMEVSYASFPHVEGSESMYYGQVQGAKGTGGGPNLIELYRKAVETDRHIPVWLNTPAKRLVTSDKNGVIGVVVEKDGKEFFVKARRGVVMTTGGYEYDQETLQNFNMGTPIYALGNPGNTGDGLRMVSSVGAALWHMNGLSCPLGVRIPDHQACQAFNTPQIGYVLVDQFGKRFCNEKKIEHHAGILAVNHYEGWALKYPRIPCYAIFDSAAKKRGAFAPSYGSGWLRHRDKWNWSRSNDKEIAQGIVKTANTLEELADIINVPKDALVGTIAKWNEDIKSPAGIDTVFGREVNGKQVGHSWPYTDRPTKQAAPIEQGPFYALELYPTLLNTQGGPRHNAKAQVLDGHKQPIRRLYVAGELGSLWGFIYQGCGNNAESLIFGRVAGSEVAKEKPWS